MIFLFHGGDSYASWQNLLAEVKKIGKSPRVIFGDEVKTFNDIIAGAENYSLFLSDTPKATVIRRLSENKSKTLVKEIEDRLSKGYKDNLYLWEDGKLDKYSAVAKLAAKHGKIAETRTPGQAGINKFVADLIKERAVKINSQCLQDLLVKLPADKNAITNELEKLIMLARSDGDNEIKDKHLEAVTTNQIESQVWDLTDAISKRDKKVALKLVNRLYKRDDEFPLIVAAMANQLELLYVLKENIPTDILLEKFKIHPFIIEKNRKYAGMFTKDQLKMLFQKLTNLDFNVKQGRIEGRLGLNLLITTL